MRNKLVDRPYLRYYNERLRFEIKSYGTVMLIVVEIPYN
jgi:hypothetical protein